MFPLHLTSRKSPHGVIYIPADATGVLASATAFGTLQLPSSAPPWLVVDHALPRVIVARWPGRLFEATVLRPAPEQVSTGWYTRALAIELGREWPAHVLFGPHGAQIATIAAQASALEPSQLAKLDETAVAANAVYYTAAWNLWLARKAPNSIHAGDDHDHTLAVPQDDGLGSPVGSGLSVVHRAVWNRAKAIAPHAIVTDEDGEQSLVGLWQVASTAALHAALALGAVEPPPQASIMAQPWQRLVG